MNKFYIIGAGGFGREVADTIASIYIDFKPSLIEFIDDTIEPNTSVNGIKVFGKVSDIKKLPKNSNLIVAVADSGFRKRIFEEYSEYHAFPNVVHPTAIISKFAQIGKGAIIQAYCIIAANAQVRDMVVMNAHSGVGHDAYVGHFASIMSYCDVAGNASLGDNCFMGTGCKVGPHIVVCADSFLCAGSIVLRSLKTPGKVMGNPAKVIG